MERRSESQYFLDMTQCEPGSAISSKFESGKWTAVDYEIEAGQGKMLFCGSDTDAPPIVLKPNAKGWHAIYVGTYPGAPYQSDDLILWDWARSIRPGWAASRSGHRASGGTGLLQMKRETVTGGLGSTRWRRR